jgi:hypothetical protein
MDKNLLQKHIKNYKQDKADDPDNSTSTKPEIRE